MIKTKSRNYINNDLISIDTNNDIPFRKVRDFCEQDPLYGKLTDLNPLQIGYETCPKGNKLLGTISSHYTLHFIHKGCGYLKEGRTLQKVVANQMFILKPYVVYDYYPDPENPWEYSWICFNGTYAHVFDTIPSVQPISFTLFQQIKELTDTETLAAKYHVVSTLFDIISTQTIEQKDSAIDYVAIIKQHIQHNYMSEISVASIAKTLYVSRQYISKLFTEKENITIQQYLIHVRLERAIHFMRLGFTVSESSKAVGYADMFTFSRIFKKNYGVSPTTYIKQYPTPPRKK